MQPDISYVPDREKWMARTNRRLKEDPSLPSTPLPDGFPSRIASSLVWEGDDWKTEAQWAHKLTGLHLDEIQAAVAHFKATGLPFGSISAKTFPLPTLGPELKSWARELYDGPGFFVLKGIPIDEYSREENILIYSGVSSYVANKRARQHANGGVISHIKDLSPIYPKEKLSFPAYTKDKQVFHTDLATDIVALFALETAAEGGISRISSTARVYNELAEKRPDLIKTLAELWPFDTLGQDPPCLELPLLHCIDGHIILSYARRFFTGYESVPRSSGIPPITEAQAEALDTIHFLGEKYSLGLDFAKGDIQFINNLALFHARDGYTDTPNKMRHLLRLWLRNEELAWKLPDKLQKFWDERFAIEPKDQTFALEPVLDGYT